MKEDLKQQNTPKEENKNSSKEGKEQSVNDSQQKKEESTSKEEYEKGSTPQQEKREDAEKENMKNHSQKSTTDKTTSKEVEEIEIEETPPSEDGSSIDVSVENQKGSHSPEEQLAQALKDAADSKDQLLRLQAEFRNFRIRKQKEAEESIRLANVSFLKSILPIFDNIDRSLKAIRSTDEMKDIEEGLKIIETFTEKQFKKLNISQIESVGKPFDATLHEAISAVPVEDPDKKGIVIDEVERGYLLKEKVIRFSKVIVGE